MKCELCKKCFVHRTIFLLHKSVCGNFKNDAGQGERTPRSFYYDVLSEEDGDDSEVDDTDEDPTWSPSPQPGIRADSPLTDEQLAVSTDEKQLIDIESPQKEEQMTKGIRAESPLTEEQVAVSIENEKLLIDIESPKKGEEMTKGIRAESPLTEEQVAVSIENEKLLIDIELPKKGEEMTKDLSLRTKLKNLKSMIDKFKEHRKEAFKIGKTSKARRISKNIKRYQELLEKPKTLVTEEEDFVEFCQEQDNVNKGQQESPAKLGIADTLGDHPDEEIKLPPRKRNYCLYCKTLVAKFSQHLERKHKNTPEGKALLNVTGDKKSKRNSKIKITDSIRKDWNYIYNKNNPEKIIPVKRRTVDSDKISNITCMHCKGCYRRDKLAVHLKNCTEFTESSTSKKKSAIRNHSLTDIGTFTNIITKEFNSEILNGIQKDEVIETALQDELILQFASEFHSSRREVASKSYVIREMRDVTKLLMEIKKIDCKIQSLKDAFNPANFDTVIRAALQMAGYDQKTGNVQVPSIAYRLLQPIKDCCNVLKNNELKELYETKKNDRSYIVMVDDFLYKLESDWKKKLGRICRKTLKINKVDKVQLMAEEADIIKLAAHIESKYRKTMEQLSTTFQQSTYDMLTHYLIAHIMLLVRRRPVDFKLAKLRHFGNVDKHDELINMTKKDLTSADLESCRNFHIFYVPGKNLDIVPIVLTPLMRKVLETLISARTNVSITTDTLFVLANDKPIEPTNSLKIVKMQVQLKKPAHLTGNGLRHQAATFSRLHSDHPQYQDFLASVLGHSLHVHKKNYQLPMSVLQKIMVCPILYAIMKGKNNVLKDIEKTSVTESRTEEKGDENELSGSTNKELEVSTPTILLNTPVNNKREHSVMESEEEDDSFTEKKMCKRKRWSTEEQEDILREFGEEILNHIPPTRHQIKIYLDKNPALLQTRTLEQVHLFMRNHALRTQKNVTPKINRILKTVNR